MKKPFLHQLSRYLLVTLCLCFVLAACSDEEPTPEPTVAAPAPTATTAPVATPTTAQPESPLAPESPLPAPASDVGATTAVTIPASGPVNPQTSTTDGALTGRLFISDEKGFRTVPGLIVALAVVLKGDDGVEKAAGYDPTTAPAGEIRQDGNFVLDNVPPGRYGVILDAVTTSILATEPENPENSLLITIEAGKVTDLGTLVYGPLPLPGAN